MTKDSDKGLVSNIQRFSLDDGPGIRTTVFLKGCNLNCKWCHNPECMKTGKSLQFNARQCIHCGACVAACPHHCHDIADGHHTLNRLSCDKCMLCVAQCPTNALLLNGKEMYVDDVSDILRRDTLFYHMSGGGVTISGGEPLLQLSFLTSLLRQCKKDGLHTTLDTAGNTEWSAFERVIPFTDLFLYDIKAISPMVHKKAVGVDNSEILRNIRKLNEQGCAIWVRVPVIPGINTDTEMMHIADFLDELRSVEKVELLPYHRYGVGKYTLLGLAYPLPDCTEPTDTYLEEQKRLFHGLSSKVVLS